MQNGKSLSLPFFLCPDMVTLMKKCLLSLACLCSSLLAVNSRDPTLLQVGAGVFDIIHHKPITSMVQLDFRFDSQIFKNEILFIRPMGGFWFNAKGGLYTFAGLAFDFFLGNSNFIFTPSIGPGIYLRGGGKKLGCELEFRDSVELSYRLPNNGRVGAQFYHMSNASLGSRNPGTECLLVFYGFPL